MSPYELYLFDFDGLLVNTEELHYLAYKKMMADRGISLTWDLNRYCQSAHYDSQKFRDDISQEYPEIHAGGAAWPELYQEKQTAIQQFFREGAVQLMPGVEIFLSHLQKKQIKHCVVTHSPFELIDIVKKQHPILEKIPYWVTRKDYCQAKPHPECYHLAIAKYSVSSDRIVGFEDTPRGMEALMHTHAAPIMITSIPYPEIDLFKEKGAKVFSTFNEYLSIEHLI